MTSLSSTIKAKSDQLNADDLIGGPITIEITRLSGREGDQPIAINYKGDNDKPWYPCKSMRRVLVFAWGENGNEYVGRKLTLYRDPKVKFGGLEVGGIRISHMSHIDRQITMALTASKANKKPFTVLPLIEVQSDTAPLKDMLADIAAAPNLNGLKFKFNAAIKAYPDSKDKINEAKDKRKTELTQGEAIP